MTTTVIARDEEVSQSSSLQAAIARTATRSIALYFSRPVRLFRPSKLSGWQALRGLANGSTLSASNLSALVKQQGLYVLVSKHFIPPMLVNTTLGTVLWTTYQETFNVIEPHWGHHPILSSAFSGCVAGGAQAVVAAPAENVRLLLEGGSVYHGWSHAWKEVFRGTSKRPGSSRKEDIQEIRQLRLWMKDVGEMAGRGWDGVGFGIAKDMCGFAAFFALFEISRRAAVDTAEYASKTTRQLFPDQDSKSIQHTSRIVHGVSLVCGGVMAGLAYEIIGRPFDNARRIVHLEKVTHKGSSTSAPLAIWQHFRDEPIALFKNPAPAADTVEQMTSLGRRRLLTVLRTLGRVGPWGIGFLAWEAFGSGLHQGMSD
ncbi:hypothetical protein D9758_001628 [Tetrapyrgos nigripes]|uniref:Mitochondrial carrier protein n=1 Tax=Tetrapyrgos nigripes TaxID=182062 RepID=A0A8H5GXA8_9AGAR|nr:hypothetical protein D9758_001628 [Tetrapyrgos nigripes]